MKVRLTIVPINLGEEKVVVGFAHGEPKMGYPYVLTGTDDTMIFSTTPIVRVRGNRFTTEDNLYTVTPIRPEEYLSY